jgi:dCMP deaminase
VIPSWDSYFISLLEPLTKRSKDPNTQTACVIVGPDNEIRSTGYNSFPRGIDDAVAERLARPEKYSWIEHADRNAIYAAAKVGVPLDRCRMYLTGMPCMDCARAIVQVGIGEVVYDAKRHEAWAKTTPKYGPDFERVRQLFWEAQVTLTPWQES